jgi:hypothetical protein
MKGPIFQQFSPGTAGICYLCPFCYLVLILILNCVLSCWWVGCPYLAYFVCNTGMFILRMSYVHLLEAVASVSYCSTRTFGKSLMMVPLSEEWRLRSLLEMSQRGCAHIFLGLFLYRGGSSVRAACLEGS